jgi:hypothetical protein
MSNLWLYVSLQLLGVVLVFLAGFSAGDSNNHNHTGSGSFVKGLLVAGMTCMGIAGMLMLPSPT